MLFSPVAPKADKTSQALLDDAIEHAAHLLAKKLPQGNDSEKLVDELRATLRQAIGALEEVHGHFGGVLETLIAPERLSSSELAEVGKDERVLAQLDVLIRVTGVLRQRLVEAAKKVA
jgi:hypothetical protein